MNDRRIDDWSTRTTVVVGASRGLGRGIALAFADAGAPVVALARSGSALAELAAGNERIRAEVADATDEAAASIVLGRHRPAVLILAAGAVPPAVVVSSGAAINGSPVSGGYAGAKATQRFLASYAQEEVDRAGVDVTFTTVMPRMTPLGDVGLSGVRAYAARSGQTEAVFVEQLGPLLTPDIAGAALVELVRTDPTTTAAGYVLTAAGLQAVA